MKLSEEVRRYVQASYLNPARQRGQAIVEIKAGDVHQGLRWVNRVPSVCTTLGSQKFQRETGVELVGKEGPPSGMGTRMTFTYRIADAEASASHTRKQSRFDALRGIARSAFRELGGGENFIRRERESLNFIKSDRERNHGKKK